MKTYHKITVMLGAALMLCSCADYLIREPQDALDPATCARRSSWPVPA